MNNQYHNVFLLLGGNLGPVELTFQKVIEELRLLDCQIIRTSGLYESPPWGFDAEQSFLNQVLYISTLFTPEELLKTTQVIENKLGRTRDLETKGYASRNIDIDILYYDDIILELDHLKIPHPQIQNRRFTLMPLVEVGSDYIHPIFQKSNHLLLGVCNDHSTVTKK